MSTKPEYWVDKLPQLRNTEVFFHYDDIDEIKYPEITKKISTPKYPPSKYLISK